MSFVFVCVSTFSSLCVDFAESLMARAQLLYCKYSIAQVIAQQQVHLAVSCNKKLAHSLTHTNTHTQAQTLIQMQTSALSLTLLFDVK